MYGTRLHQETSAEEIERLLDDGWNVDAPGWMGETPLHSAAKRGLSKIALVLIRRGANVNARRPDRLDTPLHFAPNAEVAGVLIEHGAEVEALDWSGRTPLHWAAPSAWSMSLISSFRAEPEWTGKERMERRPCTGLLGRAITRSSGYSWLVERRRM